MNQDAITIRTADGSVIACRSAIVVPDSALDEPGQIRTLTTDSDVHSKHQFHALAQMALLQFQEDELPVEVASAPLSVCAKDEAVAMPAGVVICLDLQGDLRLIGASTGNVSRLLQLAHRFSTRWVRLDI